MKEEVFNATQIVSVKLFDVMEADIPFVTFQKEIKIFGIIFQKSGFKQRFIRTTDYEIDEKYYFVKNNVIYEKAHITIVFSNGKAKREHYDSFEKCKINFDKIRSSLPINFTFE